MLTITQEQKGSKLRPLPPATVKSNCVCFWSRRIEESLSKAQLQEMFLSGPSHPLLSCFFSICRLPPVLSHIQNTWAHCILSAHHSHPSICPPLHSPIPPPHTHIYSFSPSFLNSKKSLTNNTSLPLLGYCSGLCKHPPVCLQKDPFSFSSIEAYGQFLCSEQAAILSSRVEPFYIGCGLGMNTMLCGWGLLGKFSSELAVTL